MINEEKSFVAMCKFLLWLFVALVITFVGVSGVFAESTTQTFTSFNTTAESLSSQIQCNNNVCVVYGVTQYNYEMNFEWGSVSDKTCQNASTVSGKLSLSKTSMGITNSDFLWTNVYIVNNNNASNCNWQVGSNDTTFTCTVDNLKPNFKIGYTLNSMGGQYTYDSVIYRAMDITCDTSTAQIIENNNQNTQNVINNNNQNTQNIINNQNQNTQDIIENQKVCSSYDKNSIIENGFLASADGSVSPHTGSGDSSRGVTDYIRIYSSSIISNTLANQTGSANNLCFYNINKSFISCVGASSYNDDTDITIPSGASFVRFTISANVNRPQFSVCNNGNQALNDSINDLDGTLNDDDTTEAESEASEFFSSFDTETFGLTSIITAPLNLIQSLTSSTCSQLHLPLPYLSNKYLDLPCMTSIYQTYFGSFFTIYQTITYGIIAYWVCVRIFNQVKDFKNPEHDEIEVVDL